MQMIKVRIKETGQVTDMVPAVARAMILGGSAEEVKPRTVESMTSAGGEHAVAAPQAGPRKKLFGRRSA